MCMVCTAAMVADFRTLSCPSWPRMPKFSFRLDYGLRLVPVGVLRSWIMDHGGKSCISRQLSHCCRESNRACKKGGRHTK